MAARDIAPIVSPYHGFSNNDMLTGMVRYVVGVEINRIQKGASRFGYNLQKISFKHLKINGWVYHAGFESGYFY